MGAVCTVLVMNIIELKNVSIDYPIDHEDGYSFKNTLLNFYAKAKKPKAQFFRALDSISFNVKPGEKVGLIGLNGAGKSTALRVISGIFKPSSGSIKVKGKVSPLLDFATGFEANMTGIENIQIRLMLLGLSKKEADAKVPEIIEFTELGDFIYQPVRTYSSGMFIRLAFGVSTSISPEILVADEIIGAGDAQFANKARKRLDHFLSREITMVISTHDVELLESFCTRILWLHQGKIIEDGDIKSILKLYHANAHNMHR
jgi:ABC-type polysaccharide/polyol phosphate transport system ATPase subunit